MGRRFRFQMESLLNIREWDEKRALVELANKVRSLQETEAQLDEKETEFRRIKWSIDHQAMDLLNRGLYSLYQDYLKQLGGQIEKWRDTRKSQAEAVDASRLIVVNRHQEVKKYEKLKEQARERFRKDHLAKEGKTLDEMGQKIYNRPGKGDREGTHDDGNRPNPRDSKPDRGDPGAF